MNITIFFWIKKRKKNEGIVDKAKTKRKLIRRFWKNNNPLIKKEIDSVIYFSCLIWYHIFFLLFKDDMKSFSLTESVFIIVERQLWKEEIS